MNNTVMYQINKSRRKNRMNLLINHKLNDNITIFHIPHSQWQSITQRAIHNPDCTYCLKKKYLHCDIDRQECVEMEDLCVVEAAQSNKNILIGLRNTYLLDNDRVVQILTTSAFTFKILQQGSRQLKTYLKHYFSTI